MSSERRGGDERAGQRAEREGRIAAGERDEPDRGDLR
jgi:hypothetical protein